MTMTMDKAEMEKNSAERKELVVQSEPMKWNLVSKTSGPTPMPRHGHRAVAYRDLMIVFGGGNEGIISELHVYSTTTNKWFAPEVRGDIPLGVAAYGMVCDAQLRIFIFGGMVEMGTYSNDLYELQTRRWEWKRVNARPPPTGYGPCPRIGHSFTLDTTQQVAYLFGGLAHTIPNLKEQVANDGEPELPVPIYLNDIFCLDLKSSNTNALQWKIPKVRGEGPSPRESHSAAFYEHPTTGRRQLIIYGGMARIRLGDLWILDLNAMEWRNPMVAGIPPLPRSLHTANIIGNRMFIFGGWVPVDSEGEEQHQWMCTESLAILGNLDTMPSWEETHLMNDGEGGPTHPGARAGHCSASINQRVYVWSGRYGYHKVGQAGGQVCYDNMYYLETGRPSAPTHLQLLRTGTNSLEITWAGVPNAGSYLVQIQKQPETLRPSTRPPTEAIQPTPPGLSPATRATAPSTSGIDTPRQQINTTPIADGLGGLGGGRALVVPRQGMLAAPPIHIAQGESFTPQHQPQAEGGADAFTPLFTASTPSPVGQPPIGVPTFSSPPPPASLPRTTYTTPTAPKTIDQSMPSNILDEALNDAEIFDGSDPNGTKAEGEQNNNGLGEPSKEAPSSGGEAPVPNEELPPTGAQEKMEVDGLDGDTTKNQSGEEQQLPLPEPSGERANFHNDDGQPPLPPTLKDEGGSGDEPKQYFNLTPVQPTMQAPPPVIPVAPVHPVRHSHFPNLAQHQQQSPLPSVDLRPNEGSVSSEQHAPQLHPQLPTVGVSEDEKLPPSFHEWCDVGVVSDRKIVITHYHPPPSARTTGAAAENRQEEKVELEPGTAYKLRIAAINSLGQGAFSAVIAPRTSLPGFPGAPSSIKITKCAEGAGLSWEPPQITNGIIHEYMVCLAVRSANVTQLTKTPGTVPPQVFLRVYSGPEPKCIVTHDRLQLAHLDLASTKPSMVFRIAAKNEKGYGPATQVRWVHDANRPTPSVAPTLGYGAQRQLMPVMDNRHPYIQEQPQGVPYYPGQGLTRVTLPQQQTQAVPHYTTKRLRLER